jgi:dUTP pyrophosphatase
MIKVKRAYDHKFPVPSAASNSAAAIDLYSTEDFTIFCNQTVKIKTGWCFELPPMWCGLVWPRSGLDTKYGIHPIAGLIDSDYRGEVVVFLARRDMKQPEMSFKAGERIAQLIVTPHYAYSHYLTEVNELSNTVRGEGGFGSTGQ